MEKVQISKHLVNSPVVVLSADYGWTAQMEKVIKRPGPNPNATPNPSPSPKAVPLTLSLALP